MRLIKGKLYRITQKGCVLPNLYRFEREDAERCQLHGDYIGQDYLFVKRRNSDVRPWGTVLHRFGPHATTFEEVEG